jgi:hypothetical protein
MRLTIALLALPPRAQDLVEPRTLACDATQMRVNRPQLPRGFDDEFDGTILQRARDRRLQDYERMACDQWTCPQADQPASAGLASPFEVLERINVASPTRIGKRR